MKLFFSAALPALLLAARLAGGQAAPSVGSSPVSAPATVGLTVPSWLPPDAPYQPSATRLTDVTNTQLDVRFDYAHQHLLGTAVLTLRTHFYPQRTAVLDARGFTIQAVQLVASPADRPLLYQYDGRQLTIDLGRAYSREQPYQLRISYVAKPNELPAGGSAAITSDKGLYFINPLGKELGKPRQIWTQGETESNSCWFPTIDHPNQRMTQELTLTVESQFKTLSNGLLVASHANPDGTRTDTWRQTVPAAPYLTMLAVGDFAVVADTWRGKAVEYYVEPKFQNTARAVFGHTPAMLEFYSQQLGVEFPWEKYAQIAVRDYVSGAMENTTATVHGASIQATRRELLDADYEAAESVIAHELFHHWFGDYVTCEAWSNLPLNESFANYAQFLWAEHQYGPAAAALVQQQDLTHYLEEAADKREPLIRYHYAHREDMFDRHSYEKGGRVLHMLRCYVGDDAFFAALHRYLVQNKLTAVEISKLRTAFEETTGEDLQWFFDQWFRQRGHPELKITHTYAGGQVRLRVQQTQDTLFQPVFRLPVTVTVWQQAQATDHRLLVTKTDETFLLPAAGPPQLVKFDSQGQLLAELNEERTQEELIFQFFHARNYLQQYEALELVQHKATDPAVAALFRVALADKFYAVRRAALSHLHGYRGPGSATSTIRTEVQRLATADPHPAVRAEALATLTTFADAQYAATYQAALHDSSYQVEAAAVRALAQKPGAGVRAQLATLAATTNSGLLVALATYYAQQSGREQTPWFLRHLPDLTNLDLYQYLEHFGIFLGRLPATERQPGVSCLENLARSHPQYFVRLAAYRSLLGLLPSQPDLKAVLLAIKAQETDERLKTAYNAL